MAFFKVIKLSKVEKKRYISAVSSILKTTVNKRVLSEKVVGKSIQNLPNFFWGMTIKTVLSSCYCSIWLYFRRYIFAQWYVSWRIFWQWLERIKFGLLRGDFFCFFRRLYHANLSRWIAYFSMEAKSSAIS